MHNRIDMYPIPMWELCEMCDMYVLYLYAPTVSIFTYMKKGHFCWNNKFHTETIQKISESRLLQISALLICGVACCVFGEEDNNVPLNLGGPIGRPVDWHTSKDVDTECSEKELTRLPQKNLETRFLIIQAFLRSGCSPLAWRGGK